MEKAHIISEIQRTSAANGGKPLGIDRFREETGIDKRHWYGVFWAKWSEAIVEAGFEPNQFGETPLDQEAMLVQIAEYTRELGHIPTKPELRLRKRSHPEFPSGTTIRNRLGTKAKLLDNLADYCQTREVFSDVLALVQTAQASLKKVRPQNEDSAESGHVYLLRHGDEYKIGRSSDASRRYKEIRTQMPYRTEEVHVIETDDPVGIEKYWHNRFKEKRLEGEWFKLSGTDVRAFKKRKFM